MRQLSEPTHFPQRLTRVLHQFRDPSKGNEPRRREIHQFSTITDKMAAALPNISSDLVWEVVRESLKDTFILVQLELGKKELQRWTNMG